MAQGHIVVLDICLRLSMSNLGKGEHLLTPLRIGILGAAPIAVAALIRPARRLPNVEVVAIAARDPERARHYAARQRIPGFHRSYAALLEDPTIDTVYIALPNSLHAEWSIRALRAGKHVLCEKPLAANAHEAEQMARAAADTGRVLVEAFHYRYHPLAARLKAILDSGEIGQIQRIETEFSVPLLQPRSIQFRYDLGGGATMDVGCYAINLLRFLAGAEPHVAHAQARLIRPQVDRLMTAEFRFDDSRTGRMTCALLSARLLRAGATVYGTSGELRVIFPFLPHYFHRITVRSGAAIRHEQLAGETTYFYQLQAFMRAARDGAPAQTDPVDAITNMRLIDAIYRAAGLRPRGLV
jgi:predicted dehydrogenase